jgi:hypothetical protein
VSASPDVWLRVDFRDGIWQFTEWAYYDIARKLHVMEDYLRREFDGAASVAGFVISTGAVLAQGRFADEAAQSERGSIALRRNLPPIRIRETLIVPMTDEAVGMAKWLAAAYADEPNSLGRSLKLAGLGSVDEIFPTAPASTDR